MPESIDEYETIILAYPNYWGTFPMAVATFIDNFDFAGKTVLPLCTNEGSGMGHSESDLRRMMPGANIKGGLSVTGSRAASASGSVKKWLSANGVL